MCYLAVLSEGASLSEQVVDSVLRINPDGVGIITTTGACLRWLSSADPAARAALVALRGPAIVHARMATVGGRHWHNVHPFQTKWGAFAHNGTLAIKAGDGLSDSATLASHLTSCHAAGALALLDMLASSSNKFAAWTPAGITTHGQFSDVGDGVQVANFYSWEQAGRASYAGYWDGYDDEDWQHWTQPEAAARPAYPVKFEQGMAGSVVRDTQGTLWARRGDVWTIIQTAKKEGTTNK